MRKDTLDEVTRYIRNTPTASVRSIGDVHGIGSVVPGRFGDRGRREGEVRRACDVAVKETILVEVWVKRVSMPSEEVSVAGLGATRGGSVNERRVVVLKEAERTRSKEPECAGEDMAECPSDHDCCKAEEIRTAWTRAGDNMVVTAAGRKEGASEDDEIRGAAAEVNDDDDEVVEDEEEEKEDWSW